eukprot:5295203-Prymnesium_polylepis.1
MDEVLRHLRAASPALRDNVMHSIDILAHLITALLSALLTVLLILITFLSFTLRIRRCLPRVCARHLQRRHHCSSSLGCPPLRGMAKPLQLGSHLRDTHPGHCHRPCCRTPSPASSAPQPPAAPVGSPAAPAASAGRATGRQCCNWSCVGVLLVLRLSGHKPNGHCLQPPLLSEPYHALILAADMTRLRAKGCPSRSLKRSTNISCALRSLGRCGSLKHSSSSAFCSAV